MFKPLRAVAIVATAFALVSGAYAQSRSKLTIYSALENEQLAPFKAAIEKAVPEVEVEWVRDSTGVITARFLAEKDNPKADMVLGLAASSMLLFEQANLLEPYVPAGSEQLRSAFRDTAEPRTWTGMDAFLGVICFNTVEAKKAGISTPSSWKDLLDPKYKGQLVMPHPASSGTGYLTVAGWIQTMGADAAWKYMDALHQNIAVYTHSGSAPCVQAAKGERIAGISLDTRAAKEKTNGAPLEVVLPSEGIGWDVEAFGIVRGTKHGAVARKVADWAASKQANELYARWYPITAHPDVKNVPPNYPANAEARMVKMDFNEMARQRASILAEWSKRYDGKAAPRN
ncbi:MAG: putative 2-aminoethylphosphonate ABC transporter substrate-binding protein [Burkholderiales bacterium]|jgi:iron(III) transport system substrate-binding protein